MQKIYVGMATCGVSAGADAVYDRLRELIEKEELPFELEETGCIGLCAREPIMEIRDDKGGSDFYVEVDAKKAEAIVKAHLEGKKADEFMMNEAEYKQYYGKQKKIVLRNSGLINPHSIDDYIARDGYKAIEKAVTSMTPDQVIQEMLDSGLRGRGGAGFPTGLKWKFARAAKGEPKYLVVNGDEGDPGAFMDRTVLESDPHSVIEGLLVGAYAIGATRGYAYIRAEYPRAVRHFNEAIEQARERGFLGENILGLEGFDFDLRVKEGAGAFVCGEETALIASIEGYRGVPRTRPPYPANHGLWGKPTNINNVETLANIPWIILNGAGAYAAMGTEKSKGTKVFALAGKSKRTGLVEVPMGMTINEVVMEVAGGILDDGEFKGVQMGGPSGGCIPASLGDTPIDYEKITATGAIMGSGGMIVLDDKTCMVELARFFLEFTQKESCGKCIPCRVGTRRMLDILTRITEGDGVPEDIDELEKLATVIKDQARCGLGQTAPNPVLTTLKYFRGEYETHINDKKCPAHQCLPLVTFTVDPEKCTGCTLCAQSCPTNTITGSPKHTHFIVQEGCTHCAGCFRVCPDNAIIMD